MKKGSPILKSVVLAHILVMNSPTVGQNLPSSECGRLSPSPTSPHASMTSLVVVRLAIQTRYNICSFTAVAERGARDPFMGMGSASGERGETGRGIAAAAAS